MKKPQFYTIMTYLLLVCCFQSKNATAQSFRKDEFEQRRQQLMERMEGGIAIFRSAETAIRNSDVEYEFRQDSDFYYLTGFEEPESAFLLMPGAEHAFIMFVQNRDPAIEMWTGKRAGVEGAMKEFGADTAYTNDRFEALLRRFCRGKEKVYWSMNDDAFNNRLLAILKPLWVNHPGGMTGLECLMDPSPFIHEMRLIKSDYEIDLLRRSIEITCNAHIEAMKASEPGMYEYEYEAIIEYIYRRNGCPRVGFPSIVGSGPNSTVLHYGTNNRQTRDGEVILMDIGAEYGYYSADVTRTIPVNGRFSAAQKQIYEIVLEAQKAGIRMMAPGVPHNEVQATITDTIKAGLFRLGLITDIESQWQHRVWSMHGFCHWIGLDVHDVGGYAGTADRQGRILEAGMVTTIEPGIYIGSKTLDNLLRLHRRFARNVPEDEIQGFIDAVRPVAEKYLDIGVRIEDDILITAEGHEVLSAKAPQEIKAIEAMMKRKSGFGKGRYTVNSKR